MKYIRYLIYFSLALLIISGVVSLVRSIYDNPENPVIDGEKLFDAGT